MSITGELVYIFIYIMLILLWTSMRTLMAYGRLVLYQSIVGVEHTPSSELCEHAGSAGALEAAPPCAKR